MLTSEKLSLEVDEMIKGLENPETNGTQEPKVVPVQGQDANPPEKPTPDESKEKPPVAEPTNLVDPRLSKDGNSEEGQWEKRFKGYKASTDQTIHKLRTDLASSHRRYDDLNDTLGALQTQINDLKQTGEADDLMSPLLSEDVTSVVGKDVASTFGKVIQKTVDSRLAPIERQLDARKAADKARRDAEDASAEGNSQFVFAKSLREMVTRNGFDLDLINTDPGFTKGYLLEPDSLSGRIRKDLLDSHVAVKDATSVARMFIDYARKSVAHLEENLEPAGRGSGQTILQNDNSEPEFVLTSEIEDFYDKGGSKKMTQAECQEFEDKVERCAANNRILVK